MANATFLLKTFEHHALSSIEFISDVIPVLGCREDLILVSLGLARMVRLTLADGMASARELASWFSLCAKARVAQSPQRRAV